MYGNVVFASELRNFFDGIDDAVRKDRPVPRVLVATPTSLQRVYYGHSTNQLRLHRNLTRLPELLVVDDLTSFSAEDRFHLPFQIDKHRLLVESTGRMLQLIVATDTPDHARGVKHRLDERRLAGPRAANDGEVPDVCGTVFRHGMNSFARWPLRRTT